LLNVRKKFAENAIVQKFLNESLICCFASHADILWRKSAAPLFSALTQGENDWSASSYVLVIKGKENIVAIKWKVLFCSEQVRIFSIRDTSLPFRESNHDFLIASRLACSVVTARLHYPTLIRIE